MKRKLSDAFMEDLQTGILQSLRECVSSDDTLMLAIRRDYVNIYYRGGSILKLEEQGKSYKATFDSNYTSVGTTPLPELPQKISSSEDIKVWVDNFPVLKQIMDRWFFEKSKAEREFQQLVVRENNYSPISNETEYFIADIELADSNVGARFDMLAIKWPAQARKSGEVHLALLEMKYGDGALTNESGVTEHLRQLHECLGNQETRKSLCKMAEGQINQLNQLGLLRHKKGEARAFFVDENSLEVIFLFVNHNPRSPKLLTELEAIETQLKSIQTTIPFALRFFIASSAGYAMHDACMVSIDEYLEFLRKQAKKVPHIR